MASATAAATTGGARPRFTIVGAGLSGPLMAAYLAKAGYPVDLYEKRPDPRVGNADAGRSINLALSTRGITALEKVGLADKVLKTVVPMAGRLMHATDGETTYQAYGTEKHQVINSVSRLGLNIELLNLAEAMDGVTTHFAHVCTGMDLDTGRLGFEVGESGEAKTVETEHVIAADGVFSPVRAAMQKLDRFSYSQYYLEHGYKELCIPAAEDGSHRLRADVLHIWPRGRFMMIALPNQDGSFTCTLFWPFEGPGSFAELKEPADVSSFFGQVFPDAVPHMPTLTDDYFANPTSSLCTVRCFPWHVGSRVALLGDAAHAVVPFYGQGMNASFEDCRILGECLERNPGAVEAAFEEYGKSRKPDGDAISDLALQNFVEMRDSVTSRWFLAKKQLGKHLHRLFPQTFIPLYTMVTFTNIPYGQAMMRSAFQNRVILVAALGLAVLLLQLVLLMMVFLISR